MKLKVIQKLFEEKQITKNEEQIIIASLEQCLDMYKKDITKEDFQGEEDQEFLTSIIEETSNILKKLK